MVTLAWANNETKSIYCCDLRYLENSVVICESGASNPQNFSLFFCVHAWCLVSVNLSVCNYYYNLFCQYATSNELNTKHLICLSMKRKMSVVSKVQSVIVFVCPLENPTIFLSNNTSSSWRFQMIVIEQAPSTKQNPAFLNQAD